MAGMPQQEACFQIDHDYHIHTHLSICSEDRGQTPEAILSIAKELGLGEVCVTDHYWDETVPCDSAVNWWYGAQNHSHISASLPLPQTEGVRFLFGCEADMDSRGVIGLSPRRYDDFDFIIVATTHFHHTHWGAAGNLSNRELALRWVERFDAVLASDLPFGRVGIAHPVCELLNSRSEADYLETLSAIPLQELERLFAKAAELGAGIELNSGDMSRLSRPEVLRVFRTAKECGCRFYLGSDAHEREALRGNAPVFRQAIDVLELKERHRFRPAERKM